LHHSQHTSINETTLSKLEKQLHKLDTLLDGNKYFLSNDADAMHPKTKPMTLTEVHAVKTKLDGLKNVIKYAYEDVYEEGEKRKMSF
jgi:hypothetical protein